MQKKAKLAASIATAAVALIIPSSVLAADIVPPALNNNISVLGVLTAVIRIILLLAFVLSFIFLLIGGIRWITSGGDEKGVAGARNTITAALIGLVVVLLAFVLIKLVETFFNISILSGGVCIPNAAGGQAC